MNNTWNQSVRNSIKSANEANHQLHTECFSDEKFPIKIPLEFADRIEAGNPLDPLLLQVLPSTNQVQDGFSDSPLEDEKYSPVQGVIHKYPSRVLLIASRVCAIHCQYCFRQNFDYEEHDILSNWQEIEQYLEENLGVNEVILSGGDPLTLSDGKIEKIVKSVESIKHIKILRIHSRTAVVIPSRITDKLSEILAKTRLKVVMVFHINHPREISLDFINQVKKLQSLTLLNQSVLLRGVNDNAGILGALSHKLFASSIMPYYLHLLDKVSGAEHFLLSDERAKEIYRELQNSLSGYLLPKLVRDEGGESKSLVTPLQN
ncbi:MAG: EF-P beta-lysylation protein EpmB [Gammaproteobacteria bacterium]